MKRIILIITIITAGIFLASCNTAKEQGSTTEEPTITHTGDEISSEDLYNISNMDLTDEQRESINESILAKQEETPESSSRESSTTETTSAETETETSEKATITYTKEEIESLLSNIPSFSIDINNRVNFDNWDDFIMAKGISGDEAYYVKYYIIDYFTHFVGRGIHHVNYVIDSYVPSDTFPYFYVTTEHNGQTVQIRCIYNIANKCYYFECPEIGDLKPVQDRNESWFMD